MAIEIDQPNIGSTAGILSASPTFNTTAAVAPGGFIVLVIGWWLTATTLNSVSGGGLIWTIDKNRVSGNMHTAIASAPAPAGLASGTTITTNFSAGGDARMIGGMSFTGVGALDVTADGTNASSGTWSSGSASIAAGSVLIGAAWNADAWNADFNTQTAGTEALDFGDDPNNFGLAAGYRIEAAGGSVSVGGTWDTTGTTLGVGAAYSLDAAEAPPAPSLFVVRSGIRLN